VRHDFSLSGNEVAPHSISFQNLGPEMDRERVQS
jgi:hypothetical protein